LLISVEAEVPQLLRLPETRSGDGGLYSQAGEIFGGSGEPKYITDQAAVFIGVVTKLSPATDRPTD
jgi:hypothetical protein